MKKRWIYGKTVLITGGASGIGAGISKTLIEKYDCNVISVIINKNGFDEFIDSLGDKKDKFSYLMYDASLYESWVEIKKYLEDNRIQTDVLINNAGIFPHFDRYEHYTKEQLETCVNVDFYAPAYAIMVMYDHIIKSETPAFITVSSSAALCPLPGTSLYTASKSASKSVTECFGFEHPELYVGYVCPGFTKTNLFVNQSEDMSKNKLISSFMSDRDKMVKKIVRGIVKKKRRMVYGTDAWFMRVMYKFFPKSSPRFIGWVMKKSKQKIFDDIFAPDDKQQESK